MRPVSARTLLLVRHGRTAMNAADRLRGLADPPLDARGLTEAEAVAQSLARYAPERVVTSPLQRAVSTAQAIASASNAALAVDARFVDRDYGPWTGAPRSEVLARWGSLDAAPGVEPVDDLLARTRPALDALLDEHDARLTVLVTHDAVVRPLLHAIDPRIVDLRVPTASWSLLRREDGRWRIEEVDRVARSQRRGSETRMPTA